jgi:simple sugar transport system ATP-binding protein
VTIRLGARDVTRRFGPVVANDGISFGIRKGTLHAVVGENGAGKTTLMRILYGLDQPDAGTVIIDDQPVRLRGPADGIAHGIGLVQQELALVPQLSLLENLVLGSEPRRGLFIDWRAARESAEQMAAQSGVELPWESLAGSVPISAQQQVEILRLLRRGADVLILDEPTAVLAPAQVRELLELLSNLRDAGSTIVFISHKLDEVLAVADVITVLRGGRVVTTIDAAATDRRHLTELIIGEHVEATSFVPSANVGDTVLSVSDLRAVDERGFPRLDGVSLSVRGGEIVGVAGVAGNGQDELVECVVGMRRAHSGQVLVKGRDVTHLPVGKRRAAGIAYVSADRKAEGLALQSSLTDNTIAGFHRGELTRQGWLIPKRVDAFVRGVLDAYGVRRGRLSDPVSTLSGGNQQRLVLGRELSHQPAVLVASQPTRGVDIKGTAFIHEQLRALRDRGGAVLLVSEEIDELLALSDRIVVLYRGRVAGTVPGGADSRGAVGELMLGQSAEVAA